MPAQSSSILLVSGSCSVFPLREPTRISHWNLIPVPIPSTTKASSPESSTGISGNVSRIFKIPGRTRAAVTYIIHCFSFHWISVHLLDAQINEYEENVKLLIENAITGAIIFNDRII